MIELQRIIDDAFEHRGEIGPTNAPAELREAVEEALGLLELGKVRVAEPRDGTWAVNTWLKKAVLLSFRLNESVIIRDGYTNYFDKVPPKYAEYGENDFLAAGVRVVPPAAARRGSYIAPGVVLMPSFVNIGATSIPAPWSIHGPRSVPARRSARTSTCPAELALAAYWSRYRPALPSSRMIVSSVPAPKWSKA